MLRIQCKTLLSKSNETNFDNRFKYDTEQIKNRQAKSLLLIKQNHIMILDDYKFLNTKKKDLFLKFKKIQYNYLRKEILYAIL